MSFWEDLHKKEKLALVIGVGLVAALLAYALLVKPFADDLISKRENISARYAELTWMQAAALEVRQLTADDTRPKQSGSPLKIIDQTARRFGVAPKLKRLEPGENNQVRIWLEDIVYADLILWLRDLDNKYTIRIDSFTAERLEAPGLVNARVTLRTGKND